MEVKKIYAYNLEKKREWLEDSKEYIVREYLVCKGLYGLLLNVD